MSGFKVGDRVLVTSNLVGDNWFVGEVGVVLKYVLKDIGYEEGYEVDFGTETFFFYPYELVPPTEFLQELFK